MRRMWWGWILLFCCSSAWIWCCRYGTLEITYTSTDDIYGIQFDVIGVEVTDIISQFPVYFTYEEEDGTLDEDDRWVYTNMEQNRSTDEYTMDKVPVKVLRDHTMYLTADLHRYTDLFTMNQFIEGEGVQPVLEYLERTFETLSNGLKVPQLREEISNSISQHWYVSPLRSISDKVKLNYDMMPPIGELGALKKSKRKSKKKPKKKPKKKRKKKRKINN